MGSLFWAIFDKSFIWGQNLIAESKMKVSLNSVIKSKRTVLEATHLVLVFLTFCFSSYLTFGSGAVTVKTKQQSNECLKYI